jgi:hypothetical protein
VLPQLLHVGLIEAERTEPTEPLVSVHEPLRRETPPPPRHPPR